MSDYIVLSFRCSSEVQGVLLMRTGETPKLVDTSEASAELGLGERQESTPPSLSFSEGRFVCSYHALLSLLLLWGSCQARMRWRSRPASRLWRRRAS